MQRNNGFMTGTIKKLYVHKRRLCIIAIKLNNLFITCIYDICVCVCVCSKRQFREPKIKKIKVIFHLVVCTFIQF